MLGFTSRYTRAPSSERMVIPVIFSIGMPNHSAYFMLTNRYRLSRPTYAISAGTESVTSLSSFSPWRIRPPLPFFLVLLGLTPDITRARPFGGGDLASQAHGMGAVQEQSHTENGIVPKVRLPRALYERFKEYQV